MPSKTPPAWAPGVPALASSSVLIRDIRGQNASSPATSHSLLATAPKVPMLDSRPSSLDSSSQVLRAPYFMHPSVYHRGLHKSRSPSTAFDSAAKQRRRFRIGFFGTHDRDFYTKHYHFPGMNRFEILEAFFEKFGDSFVNLEGPPQDWKAEQIAVSIDARGGDRSGKAFLSQDHYFEALHKCDFVLSPPGWCMPVSHNLIEAMFCGAIPITNGGAFMAEPLTDGLNCLEFQDEEGLVPVIDRALAMDDCEVARMRKAVRDYYDRFLEPKAFGELAMQSNSSPILVSAEEHSVPLLFPGKF
jgi:glycosyltransferase involved in cell wall biosynthesis